MGARASFAVIATSPNNLAKRCAVGLSIAKASLHSGNDNVELSSSIDQKKKKKAIASRAAPWCSTLLRDLHADGQRCLHDRLARRAMDLGLIRKEWK